VRQGSEVLEAAAKTAHMSMEDKFSIGMDKMSLPWDPAIPDYGKSDTSRTSDELYSFLKSKGYGYVVTESYCIRRCADGKAAAGGNMPEALSSCSADFTAFLRGMTMVDSGFKRIYYDEGGAVFKVTETFH
jgi:hypothetical protein